MTQKQNIPFGSYQNNVYSQFGEDGIIEEVLNRIGSNNTDRWCVEFGAWDGIYLSNTYNLIKNKGYRAVLIEGDKKKYKKLCENIPSNDIIKICRFVHFSGPGALDAILPTPLLPKNFDFLSIDIDGCDYYILESLTTFRPKVICIEFNPSIPNPVEFIQPKRFSIRQGSSARSITTLGNSKGYTLVASTKCNLIFVDKIYQEVFASSELGNGDLDKIRYDSMYRNYIFNGYDGTVMTSKPLKIHWFGIKVHNADMQQIPKLFRTFPGEFNYLQKMIFPFFWVIKKIRYEKHRICSHRTKHS